MQAYQAGVSALRLSLKDVTVERAESLVDQIQEVALNFKRVNYVFFIIIIYSLAGILLYLFVIETAM